ncbi:MAG: hypothetical protein KKD69_04955 [Euryarchaeota archaeon]|nr:hypothetical protein [Euryarchaeota archaeon]MBU4491794.1 hypothetical protein [Euryarchaeota archaeon]MCG2727062.1 hypothetical protein [Candidatus Methanoperedenaceae archaeon]
MPADVNESAPSFECAWAARFPCGGGCGRGDGGGAVSKADKAFGLLEPRSFIWNKTLISKNSLF